MEGIRAAQQAGHEILMNCVISGKNVGELEDLVHLAESLGCWISFEPMHESFGIEEKVWGSLRIRDIPAYERALERLIELKRSGAPIINSLTYLKMIRDLEPRFNCHAGDIILHVAADGTVENCRVHQEALGNVSEGLADGVAVVAREAKGDRALLPEVPVLRVCGEQPALRVCARGYEALRVDVGDARLAENNLNDSGQQKSRDRL